MIDKLRSPLYAIAALILFFRGYTEVAMLFLGLSMLFAVVLYSPTEQENR